MALERRIRTVGCVPHDALVRIDERVAEILLRQHEQIVERRRVELAGTRDTVGRGRPDKASSRRSRHEGGKIDLTRAHRSVSGAAAAVRGAPRSGSA